MEVDDHIGNNRNDIICALQPCPPNRLYCLDIFGRHSHRLDPQTMHKEFNGLENLSIALPFKALLGAMQRGWWWLQKCEWTTNKCA